MNREELNLAIHRIRSGWTKPQFTDDDLSTWRSALAPMPVEDFTSGLEVAKGRALPKGEFRPAPFEFTALVASAKVAAAPDPFAADPSLTDSERTASLTEMEQVLQRHESILPSRRGRLKTEET